MRIKTNRKTHGAIHRKAGLMAKTKQTEISVSTVFDGTRDNQEVFIELILENHRKANYGVDLDGGKNYNMDKVFSDVHVG